jgi:integrase
VRIRTDIGKLELDDKPNKGLRTNLEDVPVKEITPETGVSPVGGKSTNQKVMGKNVSIGVYERYEYASIDHVTATLLWHTMLRMGSIRALDVGDYDPEEQSLKIRHRPETDTPLKNKQEGERIIAVSNDVCLVLDDWLREKRPNVADDYGRSPLLATNHGRIATTTIRTHCYQMTRPCAYGQECPHDRNEDECEATDGGHSAQCPSSVSPHALRRGGITHALSEDWPMKAVGDRANVSEVVLEKHYDQRSAQAKMEQRRQYLDNL